MNGVVQPEASLLLCKLAAKSTVDAATGCINWNGSHSEKGYGLIRVFDRPRGTMVRTHRLSYELHNGPIPKGLCVCHKCDNHSCINPDHLFAATNLENRLDSARKGRTNKDLPWVRGENNVTAKLTWVKVDKIRALIAAGKSNKEIAERYGVRPGTIGFIRSGATWKQEYDPRSAAA